MATRTDKGAAHRRHFRAMETAGTHHLVERTYRESGVMQWVRETWRNSVEAEAQRLEFGIEWQAVENKGVYRRTIVDNGCGMDDEQLVAFFNTYGGGGKPIGGAHENFGVGAKTSLLPWNQYGLVVISRQDGIDGMIWLERDPDSEEFGLRLFEVEDEDGTIVWEPVVEPFDDTDDHGVDWRSVMPEWVGEHGTALVLLGNNPEQDTVLGDPSREEPSTHGLAQFLNRRVWTMPDGVEVAVDSVPVTDPKSWPRSREEFTTKQTSARGRRIHGAHPIILDGGKARGRLKETGTVKLTDSTEIEWLLWDGDRPDRENHAFTWGFIAAEYDGELFDYTSHLAHYRQFGIAEEDVRRRLWLIIRPPRLSASGDGYGVYPNSSRNALLIKGGARAGAPLPLSDWGAEFSDLLPEPILQAIKEVRAERDGTITDESWRERLAERFGSRWRIVRLRASRDGHTPMDPSQGGTTPVKRRPPKRRKSTTSGGRGGSKGGTNTARDPGTQVMGRNARVAGGIPQYRWARASDFSPGMLAVWQPNDPTMPEGAVLLNAEHPVIEAQIEYWQSQYPDHLAEAVAQEVQSVYGEVAVAKIAHSEYLKPQLSDPERELGELRSDHALTMALLGLIAEESMIATRVGGKLGHKRRAATG